MISLPEGSAEARRSSPRSLGPAPQILGAPALQPPSAGSPGSRSRAVRAGLPLPSCGTLGTWANASGPQLPLLHNKADNRPRFTGLQGGSQEVPGRQGRCRHSQPPSCSAQGSGCPLTTSEEGPLSGAPPLPPGPGSLFLLGFCNPWAHSWSLSQVVVILPVFLARASSPEPGPERVAQEALGPFPTHHPAIQQACPERPCSALPEWHGSAHTQVLPTSGSDLSKGDRETDSARGLWLSATKGAAGPTGG